MGDMTKSSCNNTTTSFASFSNAKQFKTTAYATLAHIQTKTINTISIHKKHN